jgi:hypothetical protein
VVPSSRSGLILGPAFSQQTRRKIKLVEILFAVILRKLKSILRRSLRRLRIAWRLLLAARYPIRVECNLCGWKGRHLSSDSWHPHTICPRCESQVRHRLAWASLTLLDDVGANRLVKGKRVLHFAPEGQLAQFARSEASKYVSADFLREDVDIRLDMCAMTSVPDGSFDLVIACDVLEHVPDDSEALNEIRRVLSPSGWAVLTVPQKDNLPAKYEDPAITAPGARLAAFGQSDHLRIYGDDFDKFVGLHGFAVKTVDEHSFDPDVARRFVLYPPILSSAPLATNHRKVWFCQKR